MKRRVVIVEDDADLGRILKDNLVLEGFEVEWLADGREALNVVRARNPDLVVLDVMLPGMNGFELCGMLRQGARTPIIMLTALGQKADKLRGLRVGADDYITKPFDVEEFLARVEAVLGRSRPRVERLVLGDVNIDFRARRATKGKSALHLTYREFEILKYLAERPGSIVDRNELLREVWGYPDRPSSRSVDLALFRLRRKIEADTDNPRFIHTVHGIGYSLTP